MIGSMKKFSLMMMKLLATILRKGKIWLLKFLHLQKSSRLVQVPKILVGKMLDVLPTIYFVVLWHLCIIVTSRIGLEMDVVWIY